MKKKLVLFQIFIALVMICTSVHAAVTATMELTAITTDVNKGDTVSVTLSIKNISGTTKGITGMDFNINYDKNIFENITVNNVKKTAGKIVIGNNILTIGTSMNSDVMFVSNSNGNRVVIDDLPNALKSDTDIMTIDFIVKDSVSSGNIKNAVSITDLDVAAEFEGVTTNTSVSIDLNIGQTSNEDDDTNTNNNENTNSNTNNNMNTNSNENTNSNTTNNNTNTNSNTNNTNTNSNTNNTNTNSNTNNTVKNTTNNTNSNNKTTNTNIDNTTANAKLPATGIKAIIIPAIILIILAYVSYNRYIKYKDI